MKATPAFQFYGSDFVMGTLGMTLEQRGAYVMLIIWSWEHGPIPDDPRILCQILSAGAKKSSSIFETLKHKLQKTSGGFVSPKLEKVRAEQARFKEKQSIKGKLSAQQRFNRGSTVVQPEGQPEAQPEGNSPISSLRSPLDRGSFGGDLKVNNGSSNGRGGESQEPRARAGQNPHHNPENLVNGSEIRRHGTHAWCSWPERDGLCIPHSLHSEFVGKSGKTSEDVRAWYLVTMTKFKGVPIGEDAFPFWRNEFAGWVGVATSKPATGRKIGATPGSADRLRAHFAAKERA